MRVKAYKSNRLVLINTKKYQINWDKAPSKGQQVLQDFLYPYWRRYLIIKEMRVPGTLWRFDIVNCSKKIIVEFSPKSHHNNFNKFFHKSGAGFLRSLKADTSKYEWATETNGFKLIEIDDMDLPLLSVEYISEKFGVDIR